MNSLHLLPLVDCVSRHNAVEQASMVRHRL